MANTLLTADLIARQALRVLHQKLNFVGNITRSYDPSFQASGWKAGDTLRIALPNEFTVRSGATFSGQDVTEANTSIQVATQKGVDMTGFTSKELSLDLNRFSQRIIAPAMARLAAAIESDALSMYKDVAQIVDDDASALAFLTFAKGKRQLDESLTPEDDQRIMLLQPVHGVKFIDAVKGLFHSSTQIAQQYRKGKVGEVLNFTVYQNTLLGDHTTGTAAKTTGYTVNGATESGAAITVQTGSTTFLKGDIVTFVGANAVHPESKADLGYLKTFAITANSGGSATSLAITPSLVQTGAKQNVSAYPTDVGAVVNTELTGASGIAAGLKIFNNTIVDSSSLFKGDMMRNVEIYNNIFSHTSSIYSSNPVFINTTWRSGGVVEFDYIDNNLWYSTDMPYKWLLNNNGSDQEVYRSYASWTGSNSAVLGFTPDTQSFNQDPLFANMAGRDYSLQSGSVAIASGRNGETMGAVRPGVVIGPNLSYTPSPTSSKPNPPSGLSIMTTAQ
ncbi:hypothetical protein LCGC14_1776900 [marine sediment metagenome]|uniref:Uncharacterized protein n=1 Tax=marine sediment metagenome TaxID=412755 RepID=A0A0F9JBG7_9ZZZZ